MARIEYDVGEGALHPGSITPLLRAMLRRAFATGAFGDLDTATFEKQLSADKIGYISIISCNINILYRMLCE